MMPINATQVVSFDIYFRFQHLFAARANAGEAPSTISKTGSDSPSKEPREPNASLLDLLLRLFWIMFGPMSLCVTLLIIFTQQHAWFSLSDAFLAIMLCITIGSRWLGFFRGDHLDSEGKPANTASLTTYSTYMFFGTVIAWLLAHGLSKWIYG
jgi:hypothetical protein